jgi:hypothetical protein
MLDAKCLVSLTHITLQLELVTCHLFITKSNQKPKHTIYESKMLQGAIFFKCPVIVQAEVCNPQELHIDNLSFVLTAFSETNEGSFAALPRCYFTNCFLTDRFPHE